MVLENIDELLDDENRNDSSPFKKPTNRIQPSNQPFSPKNADAS